MHTSDLQSDTMGDWNSKPSDIHPEVCAMDPEGNPVPSPLQCPKNPGHVNFVQASQLSLEHLPPEIRHQMVLDMIRLESYRTVKITVQKSSPNRPVDEAATLSAGSRTASCRVWVMGPTDTVMKCPVQDCPFAATMGRGHNAYGFLYVATNKHVIYDDFEARNCVFEFFYDSREAKREGRVVKLFGDSLRYDIETEDQSIVSCVFHNPEFPNSLQDSEIHDILTRMPQEIRKSIRRHCVLISHPHGMSKRISFGNVRDRLGPWSDRSRFHKILEYLLGRWIDFPQGWVTRYTTATCLGSSGATVLVWTDGRFCYPITHSGHDSRRKLNFSKTYFK